MGLPMNTGKSFPKQTPLNDEEVYEGTMNAYFGQKRKYQSSDIEDCVCLQVLLTNNVCLDAEGNVLLNDDGKAYPRSVFIGKFKISDNDKSHFYKWHKKLFKEEITQELWENKYKSGDLWLALVNNVNVRVMVGEPEYYDDNDKDKYVQKLEKLMGFEPNPNPKIEDNPPPRDVFNKVLPVIETTEPVSETETSTDDDDGDIPF